MNSHGANAYSAHACSTSSDTLNPQNAAAQQFARSQGGTMPLLVGTGEGFATLHSKALALTLNVPLGWYVVELLSGIMFYPPDDSGSYIMVAPIDDISYNQFVSQAEQSFREDLPPGNESSTIAISALPEGGTLVALEDVLFPSGKRKTMWKALLPHPQYENYMMTLTFNCPVEEHESFRRLMEAFLRDLKIDFGSLRPPSTRGF